MAEPSFWRTEIWHPLTVHFPVSLLLLATIVKLVALLLRAESAIFWNRAGSYLLYLGCVTAWISIYTGDMADGIVARKLCDPTVLKNHELTAYNMAYLFTGAAAMDLLVRTNLLKVNTRMFRSLIVMLMIAGAAFLIYTGHLGASVVYQQAGGVHVPPSDCAGF